VRLLVTGGAGYLGSELVRRATASGWDVRATWWRRRAAFDAEWIRADVRDADATRRATRGVDAVVHTAYRQHEGWSTNVDGSVTVASAARGARLIHVSSDLVFDGRRAGYREDDALAPVNDYGRSKAEAERAVRAAHPEALIARTSLLYGAAEPGPQERLAREGRVFFVDEIRSPVVVGELAEALLELARLDVSGPLHLGGADDVSRYAFALLLGADPKRIVAGRTTPGRAANVSLDSSRARALLSTRLRGVHDVLGPTSVGSDALEGAEP
jgi:dTDP-4-dehydrorhamnose reductase